MLALYCFLHIQPVERGMTVYSVMGAWFVPSDKINKKYPRFFLRE